MMCISAKNSYHFVQEIFKGNEKISHGSRKNKTEFVPTKLYSYCTKFFCNFRFLLRSEKIN